MKTYVQEGCLTPEGVAVYAEAMKFDRVAQLPEELQQHIEENPDARGRVMRLYQQIRDVVPQDLREPFRQFLQEKYPLLRESKVYLGGVLGVVYPGPDEIFIHTVRFELEPIALSKEEHLYVSGRRNWKADDAGPLPPVLEVTLEGHQSEVRQTFEWLLRRSGHRFSVPVPIDRYPAGAYTWTISTHRGLTETGTLFITSNAELYKFITQLAGKA